MRAMYDSVDAGSLPSGGNLYAAYIDGHYSNLAAVQARGFQTPIVTIAVLPRTNDGVVLDVESGDATPAQAPSWVQMRRTAGAIPSVYCSESLWASVIAAFNATKVAQPNYWVAAYPGAGATIPTGAVAHQYSDPGPYDASVVVDYWPGVDTAPPTPPPTPPAPPAQPYEIGDDVTVIPVQFTTDAAGWTAENIVLPAGTTQDNIISIMCDAASGFDPQSWQACDGYVDFDGATPGSARLVFRSSHPNSFFTARVYVASPGAV